MSIGAFAVDGLDLAIAQRATDPRIRVRIYNCGAEMKATIHRLCFIETSRASAFAVCQRALARAFPPKTQAAKGGLFFEVVELWL